MLVQLHARPELISAVLQYEHRLRDAVDLMCSTSWQKNC